MTQEHKDALIEHCSKYKDCPMPVFENSPTKIGQDETSILANTITPSPIFGIVEQQEKGQRKFTKDDPAMDIDTSAAHQKKTSAAMKPSKEQIEIHRKWQAAAEAAGGHNARIVLGKLTAKKMIFDFLYDSFRPMNITEVHKVL
jgi:hypothetical protein